MDNLTTENSTTNSTLECIGLGSRWWAYVVIQASIYLLILFVLTLIVVPYLSLLRAFRVPSFVRFNNRILIPFRKTIRHFVSGYSIPSKILITLSLLCNLTYIILAIIRSYSFQAEICIDIHDSKAIVELLVVIELMVFGVLRLLSSENPLTFWLQPYTIVDLLTLSHIFIALSFGVDWIGLRSLRFLWLTQFVTVLQFFPCIRTQNAIEVIKLLVYFVIVWFIGSGILNLLEVQGDIWEDMSETEPESILTYSYLIMVTIVGYGDFSPITDTGKVFTILFIISSATLLVIISPKLLDIITYSYAKHQYSKFDTTRVPRHVIVCGHLTASVAAEFLGGFLHPDRGDSHTHVLFLHPQKPDSDLQDVIRTHHTRVQFLRGSVLKSKDLLRARITNCAAIFIIANKQTNCPKEEDLANVLRVISVKSTTSMVPVIVQLLQSSSKIQISKVKGWMPGRDIALCLNELKLGLLAQSCLCPGLSTLIANFFYNSNSTANFYFTGRNTSKWVDIYSHTAANEVYPSIFSQMFEGMTFREAASICFNKLGLILFALESLEHNSHKFYINPSPQHYPSLRISVDKMFGYFIAQDHSHVSIVSIYCECCAGNQHIVKTSEAKRMQRELIILRRRIAADRLKEATITFSKVSPSNSDATLGSRVELQFVAIDVAVPGDGSRSDDCHNPTPSAISAPNSNIHQDQEKCLLHTSEPALLEPCILNPSIFTGHEYNGMTDSLQDHIILCIFADDNSPKLGLLDFFKPLRSKHLRPESIKPVVITCEKTFIEKEWPNICDMPKVYLVVGSPLQWSNLVTAGVTNCSVCVILSALQTSSGDQELEAMDDKESIFCTHIIHSELNKLHKEVFVITDLRRESNVQFLDFTDEQAPDSRIYMSLPFASGEAFSISMFDSVTSSVFHSQGALYFVENLINSAETGNLCQLLSKPIGETSFAGTTFREFYNAQLQDNKVCIGLFRKIAFEGSKRYIITSPPQDLILQNDDLAFILVNDTL